MSSNEFLASSFWYPATGSVECKVWELRKQKLRLAALSKVADLWYGCVFPNIAYHLPPQTSLHKAMCQVIGFIRKREGER